MKTKTEVETLLDQVKDLGEKLKTVEAEKEKSAAEKLAGGSYSPVGNRTGSDEARCLRAFGCSSVKQLVQTNIADIKAPDELKWMALQLKKDVDIARFISQKFYGDGLDYVGAEAAQDRVAHCKNILNSRFGREVLAPKLKAFGSTVSSGGDEWVPTLISSTYIPEYELERVLEGRFSQVKMPSNPYDLAKAKSVTTARTIAENTAATGANFGTDKVRFTATKFVEYYILPEELNEDSAPDIMGAARDEVVQAQMRAVEKAIINGDDDGTHIDSDTQAGAADLAEKAWKGLRRQALANTANGSTTDFSNAAATSANLRTMRARMKKFGVNSAEMMILCGPAVNAQLLVLSEVATVDKFGPMATVLKGALAAYQGIPVVVSEFMREDLNATGVYDGTTTTRAGILMVNLKRWYVGVRRPIVVKIQPDLPANDRWLLASYQRKDFQGHAQSATEVSVSYGYNIAV